jgi:hypothetical protein
MVSNLFNPMGTGDPIPRGKSKLGLDTDHSQPSSAKVKNEELYSSPPLAPAWQTALLLLL